MATQTLYTFKANLQDLIKLQQEIDKAKVKLAGLTKGTSEYKATSKGIGQLGKQFNTSAKAMQGATAQANKMNTAGGKLVNTFKSAAVAIGAAFAVRAITGSIKAVISSFAEFEAQMSAVKAISGATDEEFQTLSKTALELGASTAFTATEVGKLQEEFARLGFTVDEIDAATKSTLDLAAATGESLAKSAQIAGSTLRAFGLEASLTKNVTDVMAASFTSSALNLDRFTESMKFVAPIARTVGFSLEETTAILGNLANSGIAGSIAGNSLKNILLRLGDANSKLSKKIGGTVQGVPQLVEALKGLSEEGFSATQAVELLDKRSAPAFLALIKNIDGLKDSVEILNNAEGAVTRMAAIRLDNLQGDFTILKSATEGLSIALGEQFDTSLRNIIYSLTNFVQGITESEGALKAIQTTVQLVGVAIAGLTGRFAAMGLVALYKNVILFGRGIKALAINLRRAATAQAALNVATKANPFVLVASLVATLAGAYFLLGEEASEAERKQKRLNDALNEEIDTVTELNVQSKKRAEAIREFKDAFDEQLGLMDIELATQKELLELRDLANKQAEDKTRLAQLKEENKEIEEQKRLNDEADEAAIKRYDERLNGEKQLQRSVERSVLSLKRSTQQEIDDRNELLKQNQIEITALQTNLDTELSKTEAYQRLKLDGEKTFREQKRKFYDDQLEDFRNLTAAEQKVFKEGADDKLAELSWVTDYRDLLTKELEVTGEPLKQAELKTQAFVDSVAELGFDVTKSTGDISKMNIELTVMERFVSLLDGSLKTAGGSIKKLGEAGFALNKTKDQFKQLAKLLDDIIENEFEARNKQSETNRDIALKANDEQIALMESNISNIENLAKTGSKAELASLIKANKSKFAAIKNLTVDEYKDAVDGEKGHKDNMLKIIQSMLDEENAKLVTAFSYQDELYSTHNDTLARIQNERDLSNAGDVAAAGEVEARALERSELNFFKAMTLRKNTRDAFADEQVKSVESDQNRQIQNLQTVYGEDYANNQEYQRQIIELERQTQTEIGNIRQGQQDQNVQDQLATIQKIGEYYSLAFSAFSTFFTNKMELEKLRLNEFYTAQSDDLNTSLERELEAVEGNAEAEEDIREKYALLQEANEEKKQQELRKIKKKQFQVDKANDIASAIINGALAMTKISAQTGVGTFVFSPIIAGLIAAQIAAIASQKFVGAFGGIVPGDTPKFANGGMVHGASHANGGVKFAVGGRVAELEGGEAVINKRSTAMFRGQLSEMNAAGGGVRFATGGMIPGTANRLQSSSITNTSQQFSELANTIVSGINSKEVTVSEASITTSQESVSVSQLTSTIF